MIETHVLLGITKDEIHQQGWKLPSKDFLPSTIEGRLLCYADRFHTKIPIFNSYKYFYKRLSKDLPRQVEKFKLWSKEFGIPDLDTLSKKYKHPLR